MSNILDGLSRWMASAQPFKDVALASQYGCFLETYVGGLPLVNFFAQPMNELSALFGGGLPSINSRYRCKSHWRS
jgi:hypothetical protein